MSFDDRQARRKRIIDRVLLTSQVVAVLYLAIHLNVTYLAWAEDGWINAAITLVTLGFGDLYWAGRWLMSNGGTAAGLIALLAALLCFASWIFRPWFNRWISTFTIDMLEDTNAEFDRMTKEAEARERANGATGGQDPPDQNGRSSP